MITAIYKKKKYKCKVIVREKKREPVADNLALNSRNVTLYYLAEDEKIV